MIQPVQSLEITVLVDNGTDSLSTNPGFVETEMAGAWRRGMKWLSGRCLERGTSRGCGKCLNKHGHWRSLPFDHESENPRIPALRNFGRLLLWFRVAVGTRIAPRPPHRSRRALLTHRAPPSGRTSARLR